MKFILNVLLVLSINTIYAQRQLISLQASLDSTQRMDSNGLPKGAPVNNWQQPALVNPNSTLATLSQRIQLGLVFQGFVGDSIIGYNSFSKLPVRIAQNSLGDNMGNQVGNTLPITNIGNGVANTDAATVGQLSTQLNSYKTNASANADSAFFNSKSLTNAQLAYKVNYTDTAQLAGGIRATTMNLTGNESANGTKTFANTVPTANGVNITSSVTTTGTQLNISTTSTAVTTGQQVLSVSASGALSTAGQSTQTASIVNSRSNTTTNNALTLSASGATNNYALLVNSGNVGIGTTTPTSTFQVNGSQGASINNQSAVTYTALATDYHIRLTLAGLQTLTLPSAALSTGRIYKVSNPTGYLKTISSIIGLNQTAITRITSHECFDVQSDGTNWNKISSSGELSDSQSKYLLNGAWNSSSLIVGGLEFLMNVTTSNVAGFLNVRTVGTPATRSMTANITRFTAGVMVQENPSPSITSVYAALNTATTAINNNYVKCHYYLNDRATGEAWEIYVVNDGSINLSIKVVYIKP